MSEKYFQSRKKKMHISRIYLLQNLLTKDTCKDTYKDTYNDLLTSEFFFQLCISQWNTQNFERSWRNQFAWELTILLNELFCWVFTKKKIEIIKAWILLLMWENLSSGGEAKRPPHHKSWTTYALVMKLCMSVMLRRIFQKIPNN